MEKQLIKSMPKYSVETMDMLIEAFTGVFEKDFKNEPYLNKIKLICKMAMDKGLSEQKFIQTIKNFKNNHETNFITPAQYYQYYLD